MNKVSVRTYTSVDKDEVWKLHITCLKQTGSFIDNPTLDEDLHHIDKFYLDAGGTFLVAESDNKVVGIGALREMDDSTAEIKRMRVNQDYQRRGIGSLILDKLIGRARKFGYERVILDTSVNQKAAQRLYQQRGFKEYERKSTGELESILYSLEL